MGLRIECLDVVLRGAEGSVSLKDRNCLELKRMR